MYKNVLNEQSIKDKISTINGLQIILDSDLATLYQVETKVFNQAVKRNIKRFPSTFRFQLTENEYINLRSHNVTSSKHGGRRYLPYAFTEQGVSMLSAILKSDTAIYISIKIIEEFVNMRKFISSNSLMFERFERIEKKLSFHDDNFDKLFNAIEGQSIQPTHGIFYDGEVFDAYVFIAGIIKNAKKSIKLIDDYIDETVLTLFSKNKKIKVTIYTSMISKQLKLDIDKYNSQYCPIEIVTFKNSHDRFLIIDENAIYHIGASLKDLGKKWFGFSKMDSKSFEIISKLDQINIV